MNLNVNLLLEISCTEAWDQQQLTASNEAPTKRQHQATCDKPGQQNKKTPQVLKDDDIIANGPVAKTNMNLFSVTFLLEISCTEAWDQQQLTALNEAPTKRQHQATCAKPGQQNKKTPQVLKDDDNIANGLVANKSNIKIASQIEQQEKAMSERNSDGQLQLKKKCIRDRKDFEMDQLQYFVDLANEVELFRPDIKGKSSSGDIAANEETLCKNGAINVFTGRAEKRNEKVKIDHQTKILERDLKPKMSNRQIIVSNKNDTLLSLNLIKVSEGQERLETELDISKNKHEIQSQERRSDCISLRHRTRTRHFSRLYGLLLIIYTLRLMTAIGTDGTVKVELQTVPIYFEKDVVLNCTIKSTYEPGHMVWYRLQNNTNQSTQILAVNNISRNMGKYNVEMSYSEHQMVYKLRIIRFSPTDVNCIYRCDSGFESDKKSLQLNDKEYIALPSYDNITKVFTVEEDALDMEVVISQVFPVPTCSAMIQNKNMTDMLQVTIERECMFFNTVLKLEHVNVSCGDAVVIKCYVGKEQIVISKKVGKCKNTEVTETKTLLTLSLLVTCLVIFLCTTSILVVIYRNNRRNVHERMVSYNLVLELSGTPEDTSTTNA